jgi:enoyl-CoA hydratase/carnithine racemase
MAYEYLRTDRTDDGIVTVTMAREPVNAINKAMYEELTACFQSFEADREARVVILASAVERAFTAGVDVRDRVSTMDRIDLDARKFARDAYFAIYDCAVPVIAAVNGPALGAGIAICASCDIVIASERAIFALPEITVGMLGGGSHLARLIGHQRMRLAYYISERINAAEMLRLGGVARVVPHDALMDEALAIAKQIASKSPLAVRLAKQALNRVEDLPLKEAYRLEQDYTTRLGQFEDTKEAMQAFLEKREPKFKGR